MGIEQSTETREDLTWEDHKIIAENVFEGARIGKISMEKVLEYMKNTTDELETIERSCKGVHEVMGKHYFIGNVQFRQRWVSLVDIYMLFFIRFVAKLRELGYKEEADMLMRKKDEVIDFLKTQGWTQQNMNRDWFINGYGNHCYGLKTNDNRP